MNPVTLLNDRNPASGLTLSDRDDGQPGVQLTPLSGQRVAGQVFSFTPTQWATVVQTIAPVATRAEA